MNCILFLDFDGVTHPDPCRKESFFCQLPLIEDARHRTEWQNIAVLRQEALTIRNTNPGGAMAKAKLAKIAAETTAIQQAGERKA